MTRLRNWRRTNATGLLLIGVCLLVMGFLSFKTNSFFSIKNVVNILEATSYRLILAVGMMCVISTGAIDLSVGSVLSLSAILMARALKAGLPVWACLFISLSAGVIMGVISGWLVHVTRINALIITLSTSFMYRGLSLIITSGIPITKLPQDFRSFGCGDVLQMESGVLIAFVVILVLIPLFCYMRWGHYIKALGGNASALHRAGISTGKYRISAFAFSGLMAALAGIIITARLNSAEANAGLNMEMDAICAVIMGGTALHGGRASLFGTIVAVFLLGLIRNGLTIMSVSSYYQQFITGALLLIAVGIAEIRERRTCII